MTVYDSESTTALPVHDTRTRRLLGTRLYVEGLLVPSASAYRSFSVFFVLILLQFKSGTLNK